MNGAGSIGGEGARALSAAVGLALIGTAMTGARAESLQNDPGREAAVSALFEQAKVNPLQLRMFLRSMPKGADLHNHLGGAIYAEDFLKWGAARGFCVDGEGTGVVPPPCPAERGIDRFAAENEFAYDRLVDAMSTRGWQRGVGRDGLTGHNQFFGTFNRFGPVAADAGANMLASARGIAAGDNLSYLELDHNTATLTSAVVAAPAGPLTAKELPAQFESQSKALSVLIPKARAELDADEAAAARTMGCNTPQAQPGCAVSVRYLFQGLRALPPTQVYRSLILGFMMADADPRYVGVNIVMPEDAFPARRDYRLHMAMIRYLKSRYPKVNLSLHAGELTLGLVPPEDLRDHIALAIEAGARRIGHGTGIAFEDRAEDTLARMAREGIAVEINLTSNDVILGVKGVDHPLNLYRAHGVPVVLSTDDQGVLRSDMTNEYVRAAREQGLAYGDLKAIARAGLEFSFAPGSSLWADPARLVPVDACANLAAPTCARFLAANEKARIQADLERRFARFEADRLDRAGKTS